MNLIFKSSVNSEPIFTSYELPWLDDSYYRKPLEKIELL